MRALFHLGAEAFEVPDDARLGDEVLTIPDPGAARSLAWRLCAEPSNLSTARRLLCERAPWLAVHGLDDSDVVEQLAVCLAGGHVRLARRPVEWSGLTGAFEEKSELTEPRPVKQTTWVEFAVVDDVTGDPVSGVKLAVDLPDGSQRELTTPASGSVEIDPVDFGNCRVSAPIEGIQLGNTLELSRIGLPSRAPLQGRLLGDPDAKRLMISEVIRHRVRTGESLVSLGEQYGISWKEIARYNFGTDVPKEVNRHLHEQVGCWKKTKDRNNYVFDDTDKPGILYIPRKLLRGGLSTGQTHVLCVRRMTAPSKPFVFSF